MYAVIETGGKQYRVKEGDVIVVEKLKAEAGDKVEFDKVLCLGDGNKISIGQPYLESVVTGQVVENGKGEKVIIFKYKSKKDYRKKQGHRQPFSKVEILSLDGKPSQKKEAVKDVEPVKHAPVQEDNLVKIVVDANDFKGMRKAEIIEFAKTNKIEINEKDTIAELIEVIIKAMAK